LTLRPDILARLIAQAGQPEPPISIRQAANGHLETSISNNGHSPIRATCLPVGGDEEASQRPKKRRGQANRRFKI
jgi:hypothetical protein